MIPISRTPARSLPTIAIPVPFRDFRQLTARFVLLERRYTKKQATQRPNREASHERGGSEFRE
jgi:hypothetical protein